MQIDTPTAHLSLGQPASTPDFIARSCPNCRSDDAKVERSAKQRADGESFDTLRKHWFGFFKQSMFFDYSRCQSCQMLFNKNFFSGKRLAELYASMPDNTAGQDLTNLKKTQSSYFQFLSSQCETSGTYLEIGPDIGLLTEIAATKGSYSKYYLIEPNADVHPKLRASIGRSECLISSDIFDLSHIPDGSVDTAVAIHVFDHMLDPRATADELFAKLKPGGNLLVVTHDENSLLARILKDKWPAHCLQHPHLFNRETTKAFFAASGFDHARTAKSHNHFTLGYLVQHFWWSLGLGKITPPNWLNIALPLKLGNIISVLRKP